MATRTITGLILRPDGTPHEGARVRFVLSGDGYDPTAQYPAQTITATADEDGAISVALWPNEAGGQATYYRVVMPSGETHRVTVPEGEGALSLSVLLEAGVTEDDPQYPTLLGYVDERVDATVAGEVAAQIGDAVTQTAADADRAEAARTGAETAQAAAEAARDEAATYAGETVQDQALYIAELPDAPPVGRRVYLIETARPYWYDGDVWRDAAGEELDLFFAYRPGYDLSRMSEFTRASKATYTASE